MPTLRHASSRLVAILMRFLMSVHPTVKVHKRNRSQYINLRVLRAFVVKNFLAYVTSVKNIKLLQLINQLQTPNASINLFLYLKHN